MSSNEPKIEIVTESDKNLVSFSHILPNKGLLILFITKPLYLNTSTYNDCKIADRSQLEC